jgi:hypothetical protein
MIECAWSVSGNLLRGRNRNTPRKICSSDILSTVILTWIRPTLNMNLREEKLKINPLEVREFVIDG